MDWSARCQTWSMPQMPIIDHPTVPVRRVRMSALAFGLLCAATACGTSTLALGRDVVGGDHPPPAPPSSPQSRLPSDESGLTSTWEWVNPAPQGNRIRGMGGSADDDVWLVGDGNTVMHWDGEKWTDRHGSVR